MLFETTMIGRVGNDATVRQAGSQAAIGFSVAYNEKWTDAQGQPQEKTIWVSATLWRPADKTRVAEYIRKGDLIFLRGQLTARTYTAKDGTIVPSLDMRVFDLKLLGGNSGGNQQPAVAPHATAAPVPQAAAPKPTASPAQSAAPSQNAEENLDDLPF